MICSVPFKLAVRAPWTGTIVAVPVVTLLEVAFNNDHLDTILSRGCQNNLFPPSLLPVMQKKMRELREVRGGAEMRTF